MSVKSIRENEQKIIRIDLYFDDGSFVTLDKLIDYDIDLTKKEIGYIEVISAFNNRELFSRFCSGTDNVTKIYFTMNTIVGKDDAYGVIMLCDMYIKSLVLNSSIDAASEMVLRLEGMVK